MSVSDNENDKTITNMPIKEGNQNYQNYMSNFARFKLIHLYLNL